MRFKERVLPFAALQINPVAGDPDATLVRFRSQLRTVRQRHPDVGLVIADRLLDSTIVPETVISLPSRLSQNCAAAGPV